MCQQIKGVHAGVGSLVGEDPHLKAADRGKILDLTAQYSTHEKPLKMSTFASTDLFTVCKQHEV